MIDPVIRVSKNYYPQTLLEECKYEIKKTKMENFINDDLDLSSLMMKLAMNLIIMNNLLKFKF